MRLPGNATIGRVCVCGGRVRVPASIFVGQSDSEAGHRFENQFLFAAFEALMPSGASQPRGKTMAKKAKAKKAKKARKKK
jgi:hypothetical protein